MNKIAIIGAGITGLVTAHELRRANVPFVLFESGDRVGGVIRMVRENGFLAEDGPNTLLETSPRITALIRDLGLESRRRYSNPEMKNRFIVRRGQPRAMPLSPTQFLTSGFFSWSAKLALLREPFVRPSPPDLDESLADFVVRRLGREFLDYAINPFVAGVYAGDPRRLSVRHAFAKLHALEQKYGSLIKGQIKGAKERKQRGEVAKDRAKMMSFDHGLQVLTDALGDGVGDAIRFNTPVNEVRRVDGGWTVNDHADAEVFSQVVLTSPAHRLAELKVVDAGDGDLKTLAAIVYPPVTSLTLGFRREDVAHPLNGFGMLIPQVERFNCLGTIFTSSLFADRAPAGHVTLTSYLGGMRSPELALKSPDKVRALIMDDLRRLLGVSGEPVWQHLKQWPKAIPQYEVGYGRFQDFMTAFEQSHPGLLFAGHYRDGISLSDSILAGFKAAERVGGAIKPV